MPVSPGSRFAGLARCVASEHINVPILLPGPWPNTSTNCGIARQTSTIISTARSNALTDQRYARNAPPHMASTTSLMVASACSATCRSHSRRSLDRAPSDRLVQCGQCQRRDIARRVVSATTRTCPGRPWLDPAPRGQRQWSDDRAVPCLATDACAGTSHKVGI